MTARRAVRRIRSWSVRAGSGSVEDEGWDWVRRWWIWLQRIEVGGLAERAERKVVVIWLSSGDWGCVRWVRQVVEQYFEVGGGGGGVEGVSGVDVEGLEEGLLARRAVERRGC